MKDKAIFERFIQEERQIQESWQIFELFEEERRKWREELAHLEADREAAQKAIDALTLQVIEVQESLERAKEQLKEREEALLEVIVPLMEESALDYLEVIGKGGKVVKARAARNYYPEAYVATLFKEREELLGEKGMRERVLDLELENAKLKIELRDLANEAKLEEEGIIDEAASERA